MIAKVKAKELFNEYYSYLKANLMNDEEAWEDAKQCALIAVDLIIYHTEEDSSNIPLYEYYLKVKQEIEKL